MSEFRIIEGDCLSALARLPEQSVQTCVTSPPYWGLRDYGSEGQLGLEPTPEEYVANMVEVFREVRRVLRDDGTLWLNLGDSYGVGSLGRNDADRNIGGRGGNKKGSGNPGRQGRVTLATGLKQKDLVGIPWMVAFALRADGWYLRSDIIWAKPNPMPESVTDRPTKAHEYLFLLAKGPRYYWDADAIREEGGDPGKPRMFGAALQKGTMRQDIGNIWEPSAGRNKRSVWTVTTQPFPGAHFATFPPKLIEPCILAGSSTGDTVLDPFNGAGTTGVVALRHDRDYIGIELNPEYAQMARDRIYDDAPLLNLEAA